MIGADRIGANSTAAWERRCVAAAGATGSFPLLRLSLLEELAAERGACFSWRSPRGFRSRCCRDELGGACSGMNRTARASLGWTRACPTVPRRANASRPAALPRRGVLSQGEFDATKARVLEHEAAAQQPPRP